MAEDKILCIIGHIPFHINHTNMPAGFFPYNFVLITEPIKTDTTLNQELKYMCVICSTRSQHSQLILSFKVTMRSEYCINYSKKRKICQSKSNSPHEMATPSNRASRCNIIEIWV